jgi:hypothetical protein
MNLGTVSSKLLIDYFRFVAAGVVVAILAGGYFFLVDSQIEELQTSGYLERAKVEVKLETQKNHLSRLTESITKFDRVLPADKLKTVDAFLPTGANFPELVLTIEDIAQEANLDLDALAVGLVTPTGTTETSASETSTADAVAQAASIPGVNLQAQDVTISVSNGRSYETFKRFVGLLESSQRLFDVLSVSFNHPVTNETGTVDAQYSVVVRTYYLPVKP